MSKAQQKIDPAAAGQLSLFETVVRQEMEIAKTAQIPGSLNIRQQIIATLKYALRHAGKSCGVVADEMTLYTGEAISEEMIRAWLADSKKKHRFPLEYLPAFRRATGNLDALNVVSQACGAFTLRGPDALRADIRKLDEQRQTKKEEEKAIDAEKKRLETLLHEVEGRL